MNHSWSVVTVPARQYARVSAGLWWAIFILLLRSNQRTRANHASCVFSPRSVWAWAGAHMRVLLWRSGNQSGSFSGEKSKLLLFLEMFVVVIYPTVAAYPQQPSSVLKVIVLRSKDGKEPQATQELLWGTASVSPLCLHFCFCYKGYYLPASALAMMITCFPTSSLWGTRLCSKTLQKHFYGMEVQSYFVISISTAVKSLHYVHISISFF